jgi:hypothetical protein
MPSSNRNDQGQIYNVDYSSKISDSAAFTVLPVYPKCTVVSRYDFTVREGGGGSLWTAEISTKTAVCDNIEICPPTNK